MSLACWCSPPQPVFPPCALHAFFPPTQKEKKEDETEEGSTATESGTSKQGGQQPGAAGSQQSAAQDGLQQPSRLACSDSFSSTKGGCLCGCQWKAVALHGW